MWASNADLFNCMDSTWKSWQKESPSLYCWKIRRNLKTDSQDPIVFSPLSVLHVAHLKVFWKLCNIFRPKTVVEIFLCIKIIRESSVEKFHAKSVVSMVFFIDVSSLFSSTKSHQPILITIVHICSFIDTRVNTLDVLGSQKRVSHSSRVIKTRTSWIAS